MSLFFQTDHQLKESLDKLPTSYSNSEIKQMITDLQRDLQQDSRQSFESLAAKVMYFSEKHKELCLSFPMLFRSTVKGSFTTSMLDSFLETRQRLQSGELDKEQAQNHLVDEGVKYISKQNL